jgi:hypothetical protein
MHSAIVVATIPSDQQAGSMRWQGFLATISPLEKMASISALAENVWEVDFQKSRTALPQQVLACVKYGIAYRILPLGAAAQSVPAGSTKPR